MIPYYADESVTLYHGDMRTVMATMPLTKEADCVVTDPPYGETSLQWDRWPIGWPSLAVQVAKSMWCFGSMRSLLEHAEEFASWKFSQDIVWEKHNGTSFLADRFKRVHEHASHWYRGSWSDTHHDVPRVASTGIDKTSRNSRARTPHMDRIGPHYYEDDGTRLMKSVLRIKSVRSGDQPTEKPVGLLTPLIHYARPVGGVVLDPFAGSGSTGVAARLIGRRAVLIEADERYCEIAARRLAQDVLPVGGTS